MDFVQNVCRHFGIESREATAIIQGNINSTYQIQGDEGRYILQKINTHVFRDAEKLMDNILRVTRHQLQHPLLGMTSLEYLPTQQGGCLHTDEEGGVWRLCRFIENTVSFNKCPDPAVTARVGAGYGSFLRQLGDFPAHTLYETIPGFHDTRRRYRHLEDTIRQDPVGRYASVLPEVEAVFALRDKACCLQTMNLPLRVTHNDTKSNNILLDKDTREPVCVIDLDTVMPGYTAWDFGDCVRSVCNRALEDDPDGVRLDMGLLEALARGYLSQAGDVLTPREKESLALGPLVMTAELAVRFLDDYLDGDNYFRCEDPEHNLRRTRTQLELCRQLEEKADSIQELILTL